MIISFVIKAGDWWCSWPGDSGGQDSPELPRHLCDTLIKFFVGGAALPTMVVMSIHGPPNTQTRLHRCW